MTTLYPFDFNDPQTLEAAASDWNAACGPDLAFSARFISQNSRPLRGVERAGWLALKGGEALGFVITSAVMDDPSIKIGWVDAIAVHPKAQKSGMGGALMDRAETWLAEKGCTKARLGGGLRAYTHGLPSTLPETFFIKRGYQRRESEQLEWDLARTLDDYQALVTPPAGAIIAPMQAGQEPLLLEFMTHEYPGRWQYEVEVFIADGGRPSDYLLLSVDGRVEGFCRLTLEDSERSIERFYMHRLPHPWGQFGPLGLSRAMRGRGLGGYLIDFAALHMKALGVRGCLIDWTNLLDFYGKFGFRPYREYITLLKPLSHA
jgi:GNAT superfamily N-acetyltransferase